MDKLPGIEYAAPPVMQAVASALAWPPRLIVIHDTGNPSSNRYGEASYAHTRSLSGATSAHFYVDAGGVLGSLSLSRQAWAAYSYANRYGIHIEMCGMNAGAPNAVPVVTIARTAALVRQLCAVSGVPAAKLTPAQVAAGWRGVCGHWDITSGLGVGDHDDPGRGFDWNAFMAQVNNTAMTNTTPGGTDVGTLDGIQAVQLSNTEAMLGAIRDLSDAVTLNPGDNKPRPFPSALAAMVKGMRADLAALKAANAAGGVDPAAVAALVVEQLGPLLPTLSDIEGIVDAKVKAALNATRFNVVTGG